jgi:hypothetical protein
MTREQIAEALTDKALDDAYLSAAWASMVETDDWLVRRRLALKARILAAIVDHPSVSQEPPA